MHIRFLEKLFHKENASGHSQQEKKKPTKHEGSKLTKEETRLLDDLYSRIPEISDEQSDFYFDPIGSLYVLPRYVITQARHYWLDHRIDFVLENPSETTILHPFEYVYTTNDQLLIIYDPNGLIKFVQLFIITKGGHGGCVVK